MTAPRSKVCTSCGREIHPAAARCVHCGAARQKPHVGPGIRVVRAFRDGPMPPVPRGPTVCSQCFGTVPEGTDRCPHCDANLGARRRSIPWIVAAGVLSVMAVGALAVVQLVEDGEWSGYCDAYAGATDDLPLALAAAAESEFGDGEPPAEDDPALASLDAVAAEAPEELADTWSAVLTSLEVGRVPDTDDMAEIDDAAREHC